jgi:hypothetical protein
MANPRFQFTNKTDFTQKVPLMPKCVAWVGASTAEFVPFSYLDSTNKIVLTLHVGRRHATAYSFTVGALSIRPDGQ